MKKSRFTVATMSVVTALGVLSCSAGVTGTASTPAAIPTPARFAYLPLSSSYEINTLTMQEQEFGGQVNTVNIGIRWWVTSSADASTTPWQLSIHVDSTPVVTGTAPGLSASDLERATGAVFTGTLTPEGNVTDLQSSDSANIFLQQQARSFERLFPRLPAGGVAPGQTWTDTVEVQTSSGGLDIEVETITESTASSWIDHHGARALEVQSVSTYTLVGAGTQGGAEIDLDGTGITHRTAYLGTDGRFLGRTAVDTANMTATVAAMGAMIPILQVTVDTVSIVR